MNVLLAEDDAVTRLLLTESLRRDGHAVYAAVDGREAWEAWLAAPAQVLVVDWEMPGLDGLELTRRVRGTPAGERAYVLMLTGRNAAADLAQAFEAGVDDYLVKPVTGEHIHFRLLIAERRLASDAARRRAEDALDQALWNAGVREAVAALQHEINNPLAALLATLELSADPLAPDDELRPSIDTALAQTRRIVDVMKRLTSIREHRSREYLPGMRMVDTRDEE